jgi:hypothetical protein
MVVLLVLFFPASRGKKIHFEQIVFEGRCGKESHTKKRTRKEKDPFEDPLQL